jgi:filamentous hemagglutinin family protein
VVLPGKISFALAVVCSLVSTVPRAALAGNVTVDGRFSPGQTLSGPNYSIGANLGKQVGNNLFHSFGQFSLVKGDTATFSGSAATSNVIGRVTGGSQSSIDGAIRSTITGANLYLINPSGIVFGPNAMVNISGSFHASTADYLKMSDGAKFQATNPDGSTLSAAPPAAFGFLTPRPMAITVNGSTLAPGPAPPGSAPANLALVAGPVTITGATLSAPAGTIHVTSAAGTGEVPVDPRNTSALTVTSFGLVTIRGSGSTRSTLTASGGSVFIHGGVLTIDASTIAANNAGSGAGGQLVLRGDNQITLSNGAAVVAATTGSGSGAAVTVSTASTGTIGVDGASTSLMVGSAGSGSGGAVSVQTGQLALTNGGAIMSIALARGSGSPVTISADTVLADGGSAFNLSTGIFSTTSSTASTAGGGAISIGAGQLALHNSANVLSGSCPAATCLPPAAGAPTPPTPAGAGGAVTVSVGSLTVDSGSSLGSVARGTGNAGNVSVTVGGQALIERGVNAPFSILDGIASTTFGKGNAGDVAVSVGTLGVTNDGVVASTTSAGAAGNSGSVFVDVAGALSIDGSGGFPNTRTGILGDTHSVGRGGDVTVIADGITIGEFGFIASDVASPASGHGGNVMVTANNLSISGAGQIKSSTFSTGDSGNVSIKIADRLAVDGTTAPGASTGIFSQANGGSTGNAGMVSVNSGSISIVNGGTISGGTFGPGSGGSVSVNVAGGLTIDGALTPGSFTGISSQANQGSSGNAGPISVTAGDISLANQGQISGISFGSGSPGQMTIAAGTLSIASNGLIGSPVVGSPTALGSGKGGSVVVIIDGQLAIDGAGGDPRFLTTGITAQSQTAGDAGSVSVTAGSVSIARNGVISGNTFGSGNGGGVSVTVAGQLTIDGTATASNSLTGIATNSEFGSTGNAGDVTVIAGTLSLVNGGAISSSAIRSDQGLPASTGNAGKVAVSTAGLLSLSGSGARIATETQAGTTGNAGSVTVNAPQISLTTGAEISSATAGTGAGGTVAVTTPGALVLGGGAQIASSATGPNSGAGGAVTVASGTLTVEGGAQIASSTAGPGAGGDVSVTVASDITLPDRGPQITAQSTGSGNAGTITASAVRLLINNGGAISTEAQTSTANGGNITLNVRDFLFLTNSEITTSVKGQTGNGGNIVIDPQFVVLNHSSIIAQAIEGHGGNITINAGQFIPSADSIVSATSQLGISGTVEITGPRVDVNSALVVLSSELRGRTEVLRESCAARADQPISSLTEAGRGGLPQDPEATLPALYIAGRDLNLTPPAAGTTEASRAIQTTVRLTMRCG